MNYKISIIVPVFNVEKYLERCINSIINQSFNDFEIILIDDGSNDKSGLICDKYAEKDKRIKVIHKENRGISSARNCGIDESTGKYILFVDSDDWIEENELEIINSIISEKEYDLIYFGYSMDFIDENKSIKIKCKNKEYSSNKEFLLDYEYFRGNYLFGYVWNKVFNANIIKKNNIYFESDVFPEDLFFTFEVIKNCNSIKSMDYSLYHYVHRKGITLSKKKRDNYQTTNNIYIKTVEFLNYTKSYNNNSEYIESTHIEDLINVVFTELRNSENKFIYKYRIVKNISNEVIRSNTICKIKLSNIFYKLIYNLLKFRMVYITMILIYIYISYKKIKKG